MKSMTSMHLHDFLIDANGEVAEIDGPADLADLVLNVVAAAQTRRSHRGSVVGLRRPVEVIEHLVGPVVE